VTSSQSSGNVDPFENNTTDAATRERARSDRLTWVDKQGDRFLIEEETTVADPAVIFGVLVSNRDGEEGAVWVRRDQALELRDWLIERLR